MQRLIPLVFLVVCQLYGQVTYTATPGKTSIYSAYDPNRGPAAKAPVTGTADVWPFLPAGAMEDYLAKQAEIAKYTQYSFPALPPAKAPGATAPLVSAPTASWEGLQFTGFQRPTPDLAAGPNDVLMVVNSTIGQFSKSGAVKKVTLMEDWFGDVLPSICPTACQLYDPWIAYDQLHGHFLFLVSAAPVSVRMYSYLLLSVSNGPTYDGGWKNWALSASQEGAVQTPYWSDSWRMGFDNLAVYLAGNMYNSTGSFQYTKMRVIKKTDLYNPAATTLNYQEIGSAANKLRNADGTLADSIMPAHLRGQPGEAAVGLLVNAANLSTLPATYLTVWRIANPLASPVTATQSTVTGLMPYTVPAPAPQLGSNSTIGAGDTRLLKAVYRNGFLYTARDSGYPDQATTVTTDVIDASTMKLSSQSRVLNANAFFPAFDVPATVPRGAQFATANLVTGTTTSSTGTLTYPGLSNGLKAGVDAYQVFSSGVTPWGDYFGGAVDPLSGGLWVSGAFAKQSQVSFGQWGTWAAYYPWFTSQSFNDVPATSPFFDYINVLSSWGITTGCSSSPPLFCPGDLVTREQLATLIIRSMLGDSFTYTTAPYYTDVPASSPYFRFIQKMTDLGIAHGCSPTLFCPTGNVPRGDAAVLLVRGKLESLAGDNFTYPATAFFTDVPGTLAQFRYVQKMYELGLTTGCSPTTFCPDSLLTRQEIAVFLTRAFLN